MHLAIGMPGPFELVIILIIALLLFGKKLPEVARSLGKGIIEFKRGMSGIEDDLEKEIDRNVAGSNPGALEGNEAKQQKAKAEEAEADAPRAS